MPVHVWFVSSICLRSLHVLCNGLFFPFCSHQVRDWIVQWHYAVSFESLLSLILFFFLCGLGLISRPAIISIPYLIYLFCAPFVSNGSKRTCRRRADGFYWCILMTSAVIILIEIALLILSYAKGVYSLKSLGAWGQFLENIGVTELYEKE